MRLHLPRTGLTLASALFAVAFAMPAAAQQPASPPAPAPDEAELTVFTEAYLDIEEINKEAETSIAAAQTEEEKAQIRQAADERVAAVLETRKIEKERYEAIDQLVKADPDLKAQFETLRTKALEQRKAVGG